MDNRTMIEKMRGTRIPDYYDGMYLDGYSPAEIVEAAHNSIIKQHMAAQEEKASEVPLNVHIQSEVKTK